MSAPIPRKLPRQQRSQQMFERILDAAGRILAASGYEAASTHRIAAEAGVSPGSVYQYFPNKDAIVHTAVERMITQISARLTEAITESYAANPDDGIRAIVTAVLTATEENREITRVVVQQLPGLGGSAALPAFEQRGMDMTRAFLLALRPQADPRAATVDAWMVIQALQQLVMRYVLDAPPIDREAFIDGLTRLITGFLSVRPAG